MSGWLARRVVGVLVVLVGSVTLVFLALRLAPGDPADNILGTDAPEEAKLLFRKRLHLDLSLLEQYGLVWRDIATGTFGTSFTSGDREVTVAARIGDVLPATCELAVAAMLVALLISLPVGLAAAVRQGRAFDHLTLAGSLIGISIPVFWLGPLLLYWLTVKWPILPGPGDPLRGPLPLILPALVLGFGLAAKLTRVVRAAVLDVLREDYVTVARAKGLSGFTVLTRHVARNALIPVLTVAGLQLAALLTGAIVTEKVFARPGIGTLLLDAIAQRDYPVVQGCVIVVTFTYVAINFVVDLLYAAADPRVRGRS